jgi:Tol biopolymer transport system component
MRRLIRLAMFVAAAVALGTAAIPASAAFPGQNGRIVFSSNRSGFFELWSMNPDGSGLRQITHLQNSARGPWVSADGEHIAFHSTYSGSLQVWTIDSDGDNLRQLTSVGQNNGPAWSPDGSQLVYTKKLPGLYNTIYIINADGTGERQITNLNCATTVCQDDGGISWSPDGTRLVYGTAVNCAVCLNQSGAGNLQIHVLDLRTMADTVLESEPFMAGVLLETSRHPDWSPDGNQITYASTRSGSLQIWTMNADGSNMDQVTHGLTAANFSRFSPDGSRLVFEAVKDGGIAIHVINVTGSQDSDLTGNAFRNIMPSWGPAED